MGVLLLPGCALLDIMRLDEELDAEMKAMRRRAKQLSVEPIAEVDPQFLALASELH